LANRHRDVAAHPGIEQRFRDVQTRGELALSE